MTCLDPEVQKYPMPSSHPALPAFQPSSLPALKPSSLPAFQPSRPPALQPSSLPAFQPSSPRLPTLQPSRLNWKAGWLEAGRLEGWKAGRLKGWKAGRLEGWKAGRLEGWEALEGWGLRGWRLEGLKAGGLEGWRPKAKLPDVLKLGGPKPLLLDLVQMICVSCLNVRVFKNRRRSDSIKSPHTPL